VALVPVVVARVSAIVLAAGGSARFGSNKMLAPLHGEPLLAHAVECAVRSGAHEVLVVVPGGDSSPRGLPLSSPTRLVRAETAEPAMGESLSAGLAAVDLSSDVALVFLGDEPDVPTEAVRAILAAYAAQPDEPVRPYYRGTPGHPVLLPRSCWDAVRSAGDRGAGPFLDTHGHTRVDLDIEAPLDVDTVEDLLGPS
jgi:CTP:molybdopterin cytidylyltransferase MocA